MDEPAALGIATLRGIGRGISRCWPLHLVLRSARPYRRRRQRAVNFPAEPDSYLAAPSAGPFVELAVLAGTLHRPALLPRRRLATLPAYRRTRFPAFVGRL